MPLPKYLINAYKDWKDNSFSRNKTFFSDLEKYGQDPKAMFISCCDSRVNINNIFKGNEGDFFVHKNIANIVPPYTAENDKYCTSSTLEYAVKSLKISDIFILGHSSCGGVKYAYQKFIEDKYDKNNDFINGWVRYIRPAYNEIEKNLNDESSIHILEKQNIINSIKNLSDYPFVKNLLIKNELKIHGLWFEIKSGDLMNYNLISKKFEKVNY